MKRISPRALILTTIFTGFLAVKSHSAQVDYGLTLGSFLSDGNTNTSGLFQLGRFTNYTDAAGAAFFSGKDYNALQSSWVPFAGSDVTTDNLGQFYQSVDLLDTPANTRLFVWGFSTPAASHTAEWAIVSGTIDGQSIYDAVWLAPSPSAIEVNVIELGVTSNVLYASSRTNNSLASNSLSPSEGSADLVLAPAGPPSPSPVITSPEFPVGVVGQPFSFQIEASGNPTNYSASNLPAGLTINTSTGVISGTPTTAATLLVTISATNAAGTGTETLTLTINPSAPLAPGNYSFTSGEKAKIGVEPIEGAQYQWLKGGLPVRLARSNELDLTPGQSTFGPAQAGVYQLQVRQGTNTEILGPWVITHDDPTVLVYNLTLKGTQSTPPEDGRTAGASESPVTLGGFLLLDRAADAGVAAAIILTRTDLIGKKVVGRFYWSEDRPDVSVLSNGPVPGTAKLRPSRTLAAGLRGTETEELVEDPEAPLWLSGDRDMIWLSGSDALVKLDRSRTPSLVIAPPTMTGFMGTAITTGGVGIDNFTVTAKINAADTLKAKNEALPLEEMKTFIITRLEGLPLVPPFTEEVWEQ